MVVRIADKDCLIFGHILLNKQDGPFLIRVHADRAAARSRATSRSAI